MNPKPMRPLIPSLLGLASVLVTLNVHAATLLYQWDFDAATGTPAVGAGGGTLTANGTGVSFAGTGISGTAGDNALSLSNAYTGGTGAGNAGTTAGNVLTGGGLLNSFTVTMWVNLTSGSFAAGTFGRVFEIGTVANPDNTNPGIYLSMNGGNFQYGMNGLTVTQTVPLLNVGAAGTWVFLALSYDGLSTTSFNSGPNSAAYGTFNNTVLLSGTTSAAATVSNSAGINFTGTSAGPVNLGASAYAFLGNRTNNQRGLSGLIDDVRIYSGQLSVTEVNAVRVEGTVPEPTVSSLGLLAAAGLLCRRRANGTR